MNASLPTRGMCLLCALCFVLTTLPGLAQEGGAPGATTATTSVYVRRDTAATTVITPSAHLSTEIADATRLDLGYTVDVWTSASIDIVAAASKRVTEQRDELDVALSHDFADLSIGGSYRYSTENDYESHGGSLGASYDFADNNATLALVARATFDQVWAAGAADLKQPASTMSVRTSFTQVLDAASLLQLTYEIGRQGGYLASPYRYVRIADDVGSLPGSCRFPVGRCLPENSPDERSKHAIALSGRHAFGDSFSAGAGYRFYLDNWQLSSHTLDFDLAWAASDSLLLSLGYRFYVQGKAFHWKAFYKPADMDTFYTSDKELSSLTSHRISLELSHYWDLDDLGSRLHLVLLAAPTFYGYSDDPRVKSITAFESTLSVGVQL